MSRELNSSPKGDILIVDDQLDNLRVLSAVLIQHGYDVRCVAKGKMALASAQTVPPDLVLLDIKMPEMNGYEVCQQLKADRRTSGIPVIFLSAMNDVSEKVMGFKTGGVDYITKPFQIEEVLARVETQLMLRQQQRQLQRLNEELARTNQELEQFIYIIAHDLREPLRTVATFTQLLAQRHGSQLDAKADEIINFVVDGATRMETLMNDLLVYSRIGMDGNAFEPTNCESILKQVLDNLQVLIQETGTVVTNDALPTVTVNANQLMQLLQNLISNAIKYRSEEAPRIHISTVRQINGEWQTVNGNPPSYLLATTYDLPDTHWLFGVRDNGIGLDSKHAERIFLIFRRLHTKQKYPGTGVGLAICKKIVERHGGRIWVESALGEGATFYFTLPQNME